MATLSVFSALPNFEAASFVEAEWTKQEVFTGVSGLLLGQKVAEYMWLIATSVIAMQLPRMWATAGLVACTPIIIWLIRFCK